MPPGSNMTVTNLNTGETSSEMGEMIIKAMSGNFNNEDNKDTEELNSLSVKELENLLSKAIKDDDYEAAAEISATLKEKKNPGSGDSENNS